MKIPFFNYPNIFKRDQKDFEKIFRDVCSRGAYILQEDLKSFEKNPKPARHSSKITKIIFGFSIIFFW